MKTGLKGFFENKMKLPAAPGDFGIVFTLSLLAPAGLLPARPEDRPGYFTECSPQDREAEEFFSSSSRLFSPYL
jgi:hypothetical protein